MAINGKSKSKLDLTSSRAKESLGLRRLPSRLDMTDAAILLNVGEHDITVLMRAGLLDPLGHPRPNAIKYFATVELLERAADRKWLSQMCDTIYQHWARKKAAAKTKIRAQQERSRSNKQMSSKAGVQ
jgi:hypothetical protein